MAGRLLTTNSQMMCPHGGTVQASTSNSSVSADSGHVLLLSDTMSVSGCPFQIPSPSGTIPSPCTTVQWVVGEFSVMINNTPVLSESSVGLCISDKGIPQGTISVVSTQSAASAS